MDFKESQPSVPDLTDIERLRKALRLPLQATSTCLAITRENRKCKTLIPHKEKIDEILASLLLKPFPNTPPISSNRMDKLLSLLTKYSMCSRQNDHRVISENILSVDTLRNLFHKWKLSEENGGTDDEALTAGTDGSQESQPCALGEGLQRETVHEVSFDDGEDNEKGETDEDNENDQNDENDENDKDDEDGQNHKDGEEGDEDDTSSHSPPQPDEYQSSQQQIDEQNNDELDGKPAEVPKNTPRRNPVRQVRLKADIQAPTTPKTQRRTSNNSSASKSGSKEESGSISEASTPTHSPFSSPEPSPADTPDTEYTTSPTGRRNSDSYLEKESPSLNRGSSARSGEGSSFPPYTRPPLPRFKRQELHDEERLNTPSNRKNQESAGEYSTQRGTSVSTGRASGRKLLHSSRTLPDGTKTANIYELSTKSNALKETLNVMRSIPYGDRAIAGYVYAYTHKSVPGHIKIGYAKDEDYSAEEWQIVLHPVGKHKDLRLWKRLKKQKDECMSEMEVLFAVYMPYAAGHMERLIHRTLYKEKRVAKCQKVGCRKEHIEWFHVEEQRALEVVMRWAEFSEMFPYNTRGCLGESWDEHAFEFVKRSTSMALEDWWDGPWEKFRADQKREHGQQLAAELDEEKRSSKQDEISLLDAQLEIQLERNRLQQEKNELEQCATRLREKKIERDLERARERQQELQQQIERLSLT